METWLHSNSAIAGLSVPGYNVFRRDRPEGRGGGVMFYIREHLKCKQVEWSSPNNLEGIGLNMSNSPQMSITLIGIYRLPSTSSVFDEELEAILKELNWKKEIILLGDFNVNWFDKTNRKKLKSVANNHDLSQLIEGPTRITKSTETCTDQVFSNRKDRIYKTYNMVTGQSDHNLILLSRKLSKNRYVHPFNKSSEQLKIPKSEINNLERVLSEINWPDHLSYNHVEENCKVFTKIIQDTMHQFQEKVKAKPHKKHLPWLNEQIWTLMKRRDHTLKIFLKTKTTTTRLSFTSLRNKVTVEIRYAKANFFINAIKMPKVI